MIDLATASNDEVADLIEILALAALPKPLSIVEARSLSETHANVSSYKVTQAFGVLKKRSEILGKLYPFKVDDTYLFGVTGCQSTYYFTYLMLSAPSPIRFMPAWDLTTSSKLLEKIVEKSFHDFFGRGTDSVNFGFPSEISRPSDFDEAVRWLAKKTKIPLGKGYRAARFKDGGVDIFVWKSFPDEKPGVPIMLLQCTLQEKFLNKIRDVDTRLWSSWLSSDIDPIAGLCVPHVVSKIEDWNEITTRGLLFDRTRLTLMAGNLTFELDKVLRAYLENLLGQFRKLIS